MRLGVLVSVLAVGCGADGGGDDVGGGGSTLTILAPNAPAAAIAYRDGSGAWMTASGADAPLEIPIASGSYTVAIVCARGSVTEGVAYEMTLAELNTLEYDGFCTESTITIAGRLTGYTSESIDLAFGALETGAVYWPGSSYSLGVDPGTHDLVAARGSVIRDRMIVVRDLAAIAPINQAFDFEGPDAIAMEYPTTPGWPGMTYTYLYTQGGTGIELGVMDGAIVAPPVASMRPGDLLSVAVNGQGSSGIVTGRRFVSHERPLALSLPAPLQPPATAAARRAGTWTIVGATWQPQPNAVLYELFVDGGSWNVYVSPAVFGQQTSAEIPDLSQVPGWETYGLPSLQFHTWSMLALSGASLEDHLRTIPVRAAQLDLVGWAGRVLQ